MTFQYAHDHDGPEAGKVEIAGEQVAATDKAVLISDGVRTAWLPLSKVTVEANPDDTVTVLMPEWLAKAKGFL